MPDLTNTPESPPAAPVIPNGLATKVGLAGTLLGLFATALTTVLDGAHAQETKWFLTATSVIAAITVFGRMLQSAAAVLGSAQVPGAPMRHQQLSPGWQTNSGTTGEAGSGSLFIGHAGDLPDPDAPLAEHDAELDGDEYGTPYKVEAKHERKDLHDAEGA